MVRAGEGRKAGYGLNGGEDGGYGLGLQLVMKDVLVGLLCLAWKGFG